MEENVALDSSKQRKFVKSIQGIKKLLKRKAKTPTKDDQEQPQPKKPANVKTNVKKAKKKKHKRGLVYLSHIPHGFYEHQMTEYFKQFGVVTNARVIRSKRTGRSKGHAFVEFRQPTVAKIVAETMNNYLMGKRLIKAAYIPPEKIRPHAMRKHWNTVHNPSADRRLKQKKAYNADKTDAGHLKRARKILSNLTKTRQKLSELGINYDFFTPVDIPVELIEVKQEKEETEIIKTDNLVKNKENKTDKNNKVIKEEKKVKLKPEVKTEVGQHEIGKNNKKNKKKLQDVIVNKDDSKGVKLKKETVKPLKNFINIQNDTNSEDDSVIDFDSDEFDHVMENESDYDASPEDVGNESSNSEQFVVDCATVKKKEKSPKAVKLMTLRKNKQEEEKKNKSSKIKRKASSTISENSKKVKFEKQESKIPSKKQFKKKK